MNRLTMPLAAVAGLLILSAPLIAQQYVISNFSGGATQPFPPSPAVLTPISLSFSVSPDGAGNVYFTNPQLNSVFKVDAGGVMTRVAGSSLLGYAGDGGPAANALLSLGGYNQASGVVADGAGGLFIADSINHAIRRISPEGIITTVAGTGNPGFSGDGGPGVSAQLDFPFGIALDGAGDLFIADVYNYRIRKLSTAGIITTVAGNGGSGSAGDGGPAISAQVFGIAVAVDGAGNLFIADQFNHRIRQVSPDGTIVTAAGGGTLQGVAANGMPATSAEMFPQAVAVDSEGNLFVADGARIRKVSAGILTTVAGGGTLQGAAADGGPATSAGINPQCLAVDDRGNLFFGDEQRLRMVTPLGIVSTVAGNGSAPQVPIGDGGPALSATFVDPQAVALDQAGNLFVADAAAGLVRKVTAGGIVTTVAGSSPYGFSGDGGPATSARLSDPCGVALDGAGNLFIADCSNNRVRKVSPAGVVTTVAGNGMAGYSGDGGPATQAELYLLDDVNATFGGGVAVDGVGNLFIADIYNQRVRKVSPDGVIVTVAGNGTYGYAGDGGAATKAALRGPAAVALDGAGNLLIGVAGAVREIDNKGIITTVAGLGNDCCFPGAANGDGGLAINAHLSYPTGLAVDSAGNLFIADAGWDFVAFVYDGPCCQDRVRKVSPAGLITTVAGNGTYGFFGNGGPASTAGLNEPASVAVDGTGNLYVADSSNEVVRILRPTANPVVIGAVVDAASERADAVSPGKIVVIYGDGMGPSQLIQNQPANGKYGTTLGGTSVSFSGIPAPILYTSATQVAAVVPYEVNGTETHVTVSYEGQTSDVSTVSLVQSAPSFFTLNQTGVGQLAAINAPGLLANTAANPIKIGDYISLWATGEGQTSPGGVDGLVAGITGPHPVLPWTVTVGGVLAYVQYAGGAPGLVAGLMQVNVQIPEGVPPGGYVPVVLQIGTTSSTAGAVWIAVAAK